MDLSVRISSTDVYIVDSHGKLIPGTLSFYET